jgi:hypothetical protein
MTQIKVVKRSGQREPLHIEKWQAQVAKVCKGIADVSQSMIEIKAQLHFYDGITTEEIDGITLRAIVDLIDVEQNPDVGHTNYQYVAGKQRLSMLRKDVYGSYQPPHLYEIVKKNVATGLYTPELLEWYSEEDWNRMNDIIDHDKDEGYSYAAIEQLIESTWSRIVPQRKFMRHHKFVTWLQQPLCSIAKNLMLLECATSKNITTRLVTAFLLWLLLCWLVLVHPLSSSQVVCLYAVTMTLTVFLLREK